MAEPEVIAKLRLDDSEAKKDAEAFGASLSKMGAAVGVAVAASIAAIAVGIKKSIDAAVEAELAVKAFNQALVSSGTYSKEASDSFQDYAASLQKTTGVSDEIILKNASLLVSLGKLSGDGLKTATQAALDLAARLQIDVGTAFDIVTKAANGNVGMLAKYGLEVRAGASDSEKFAKALEFIQRQAGGASALTGFTGSVTSLSNSFGDIFEETGKIFTNSKTLRVLIDLVAKSFDGVSKSIAELGKSGDLLQPVFNGFIKLGKIILEYVIAPLELIGSVVATAFATIATGVSAVLVPVAAILDKILGTDLKAQAESVRDTWGTITTGLAQDTLDSGTQISTGLSQQLTDFQTTVTAQAALVNDEVKKTPVIIQESMSSWDELKQGMGEGLLALGSDFKALGRQISQTFVTGFGNAFAAFGKALVTGENAFGAFGKAVLGTLGQVAIQMGTFYIAAGTAALFGIGTQANGAGMIAGGIGLTILGGVLSALAGGGGGASGASGAATPGAQTGGTMGGSGFDSSLASEEERIRPNTGVTVNIQGNVLDRRQTGLEIAQIINESFDTDGVTTRAVSGVV